MLICLCPDVRANGKNAAKLSCQVLNFGFEFFRVEWLLVHGDLIELD